MAQRSYTVLVDDIDGSDAAETVVFGLDGAEYEIDLSEANADKLREALALFVAHGRRVGRRGGGRGGASSAGTSGGSARGVRAGDEGPSAADIRAWARENGYDVPKRGRVSAEVREAYAAAH